MASAALTAEKAEWQQRVLDLCQLFPLETIAVEIGVTVRQVSNWKSGNDKPAGMNAVRLYLFHEKHRTRVHGDGTVVHGNGSA